MSETVIPPNLKKFPNLKMLEDKLKATHYKIGDESN